MIIVSVNSVRMWVGKNRFSWIFFMCVDMRHKKPDKIRFKEKNATKHRIHINIIYLI